MIIREIGALSKLHLLCVGSASLNNGPSLGLTSLCLAKTIPVAGGLVGLQTACRLGTGSVISQ